MKVAVILNRTIAGTDAALCELQSAASRFGIEIVEPDSGEAYDFNLVLGGDGSVLRAVHTTNSDAPLVNINIGSLGYLTCAGIDELDIVWEQVTTAIKDYSWQAIYANSDEEYEAIVEEMIVKANEYGYDLCAEFSRNEAALKKEVTWGQAAKNWALVWTGNLLGSLFIAWLVYASGVFDWSNGLYGGVVLKTALGKAGIAFWPALASGILCNILVSVTVWASYGAKDALAKVGIGWLGVFLFVCTGFEHCVANMGYFFAGIFAKANPLYLEAAHKTAEEAAKLNITSIFTHNLIPVTIGNILAIIALYYSYNCHKIG